MRGLLLGLLGAMWLAAAGGVAGAQVTVAPAPPAGPPGPTAAGLESSGRVTRVDREARTITLDTGQDYRLPPGLDAAWAIVREGTAVRLRYDVDGGRNVVTRLDVVP